MKLFKCCLVLLVCGSFSPLKKLPQPDTDFCGISNNTFLAGEQLTMTVFYNVAGVYVNAGTANFTNTLEKLGGKTVFHIVGDGKTNPSYDWIYKVRDRYESFIDTTSLQPLK